MATRTVVGPKLPYGPFARMAIGFVSGALVAAAFSGYAFLMWLWNDRSLGYLDVALTDVVLGYAIWGPAVGAVVGLGFALTRTAIGAAAAGAFIMVAGYVMTWTILESSRAVGVGLLILGAILGAVGGLVVFGNYWSRAEDGGGA